MTDSYLLQMAMRRLNTTDSKTLRQHLQWSLERFRKAVSTLAADKAMETEELS